MPKIRVLHIRNCRGITTLTGPETYLLNLMAGIDPNDFELDLHILHNPDNRRLLFAEKLAGQNIRFQTLDVGSRFSLSDLAVLNRVVKRASIDIINTHDARSDIIGLLISRLNRIPQISFAHGWLNWDSIFSKERLYALLELFAVRHSPDIIVASRHMVAELTGKGISEKKIHYIPYGIDVARFAPQNDPQAIRKEFNIPPDAMLIGTVGRIHPWKGQRYLFEAARQVIREYPRAVFLLVGDAAFKAQRAYRNELMGLRKELNLEQSVILTGSRPDIPAILNSLEIFVLPSLREPFGIVAIEAQACGKPVVGTSVGGIPETMSPGKTGILVKPADSRALAEGILSLIRNREQAQKMGLKGRKRVVNLYSTELMIQKTEALYKTVKNRSYHVF